MDTTAALGAERQRIIQQYGPWTAHNIHLGGGVYTMSPDEPGRGVRIKRMTQLVRNLSPQSLAQLRILDLGCLEGGFAIECALHGAEVVGIEARRASLEKANFAKRALGLERVTFVHDDVRSLTQERYGMFDVILCLGLLYHLEAQDAFRLLEQMFAMCRGFVIIDTHIAAWPDRVVQFGTLAVQGWRYREHAATDSPHTRSARMSSSVDNLESFWMGLGDLRNVLYRLGWTSVMEYLYPSDGERAVDRVVLVALKGQPIPHRAYPGIDRWPQADPRDAVLHNVVPQTRGWVPFLVWLIRSLVRCCGYDVRKIPSWNRPNAFRHQT